MEARSRVRACSQAILVADHVWGLVKETERRHPTSAGGPACAAGNIFSITTSADPVYSRKLRRYRP